MSEATAAHAGDRQSSGSDLEQRIGHQFARPDLLAEALTHPSALPSQRRDGKRRRRLKPSRNSYERLEFLGDRVLGLVTADLLWRRFEREPEGDLTRRLTHLVRREALARVGEALGLEHHLQLSAAEAAAGTARHPGIIADVMEAVIAAIYLDAGYDAAAAFITRHWQPLLAEMTAPPRDPKTTLQEWVQQRGLPLPAYDLLSTSGPPHAPNFTITVRVVGQDDANGTASSKRAAEIAAAAAMLERLGTPS